MDVYSESAVTRLTDLKTASLNIEEDTLSMADRVIKVKRDKSRVAQSKVEQRSPSKVKNRTRRDDLSDVDDLIRDP